VKTVYLDNSTTSFPKAPGVGAAMADYLDDLGVNISRGTYAAAMTAGLTVLQTRRQLKELFHFGGREAQVIFTPGATAGLNLLLKGLLQPGDHVLVSSLEHNSVMRPLTELAERGVVFSRIPADREGRTQPADIDASLRPETKLLLVSHASNVSGTIFPLREAAEICRRRGLPLAVDGAQTAGHLPLDFDALGLSALCVPGHKGLLGPQGIGALLLEENFARRLSPLTSGGTGSVSDSEFQPTFLPDRFEAGTQNLPGIFGWHQALAFLQAEGIAKIREREKHLTSMLLHELSDLPLRVVGPTDVAARVGVVSLDFPDTDNALATDRLEQEFGILTRCGLHCAPHAHQTLGTFPQGTVRLSVGFATSEEDIRRAVAAVKNVVERHDFQ
jgi:cysteine desulfurase family protein